MAADSRAVPRPAAPGRSMSHPLLDRLRAGLLAQPGMEVETADRLLAEESTPWVEPGAVTFVWFGEAERVELLRWIHADVDRTPFRRVAGTRLWHLRLTVEDGGRFEYKLAVSRGGGEEWLLDPHNPARAGDPLGENSVCRTWGYERPAWSRPQGAPSGCFETLEVASPTFGEMRSERIYCSAGYVPDEPHPLVVVHDGEDYVTYADLQVVIDNLVAAGDIPPLVAVLVQSSNRIGEYPRGRRHARYLVHELLPLVSARYHISERPGDRVLLGASLGAVVSLATAFRYPGVFGGLVLKSGTFVLDREKLDHRPHPAYHRVDRLLRALQRAPGLPATRAFVSTGELEGLADDNRALASLLRERGVDVLFKSAWDGHHWHNWRDQLRDGLRWVLRSGSDRD